MGSVLESMARTAVRVTVVAPWFATTPMDPVIWEALSAGALDVEGCTTLESTLRSPTSSTGWRLTHLLCLLTLLPPCLQRQPCLPPPCQQPPCQQPPCQQPPCQQPPCLPQPCQQPPCQQPHGGPPCHHQPCHQLSPPQPCLVQPCNDFC